MENPNTRPYTAEELEALFNEEVSNSDMPENNKGRKRLANPIILKNNKITPIVVKPVEIPNFSTAPIAEKPQPTSKLQTYVPFIILGAILTGFGIYLYYDYHKRKEAEKTQKQKKNDKYWK